LLHLFPERGDFSFRRLGFVGQLTVLSVSRIRDTEIDINYELIG